MNDEQKLLTGRTMMAAGVGIILAILISLIPKKSEKIIIVDRNNDDNDSDDLEILEAKRAKLKARKEKNGRSKSNSERNDNEDDSGDGKEGTRKTKEGQLPPNEPKPDDKQLAQ